MKSNPWSLKRFLLFFSTAYKVLGVFSTYQTGLTPYNEFCCKNMKGQIAWYNKIIYADELSRLYMFKWKHYQSEIITLCVRWYLKYPLSYRNIRDMMQERGLSINHTTIYRWVIEYAPRLNHGLRKHLKPTGDSWHVDETYIKLNGKWMYLYRAVDQDRQTIDFWLSKTRDCKAAKKFFRKALKAYHNSNPRVITTDKYAATISQYNYERNKEWTFASKNKASVTQVYE